MGSTAGGMPINPQASQSGAYSGPGAGPMPTPSGGMPAPMPTGQGVPGVPSDYGTPGMYGVPSNSTTATPAPPMPQFGSGTPQPSGGTPVMPDFSNMMRRPDLLGVPGVPAGYGTPGMQGVPQQMTAPNGPPMPMRGGGWRRPMQGDTTMSDTFIPNRPQGMDPMQIRNQIAQFLAMRGRGIR